MNDARSQMTAEEAAARDAAYEAWVAKVRASDGGEPNGEPDAFTAGWLAGLAAVSQRQRHDA